MSSGWLVSAHPLTEKLLLPQHQTDLDTLNLAAFVSTLVSQVSPQSSVAVARMLMADSMSSIRRKASLKFTKKRATPELVSAPVFASPETARTIDSSDDGSPKLARLFSLKAWRTPPAKKRGISSADQPPLPPLPARHRLAKAAAALTQSTSGSTASSAPPGFQWDTGSDSSLSSPSSSPERAFHSGDAKIPNIVLSLADAEDVESLIDISPPRPTRRASAATQQSPPFDPRFEAAAEDSDADDESTIVPTRRNSGILYASRGVRLPSIRVEGLSMEAMFAELEANLRSSPTYNALSVLASSAPSPVPDLPVVASEPTEEPVAFPLPPSTAPGKSPAPAADVSATISAPVVVVTGVTPSASRSSLASEASSNGKRRSVRKSRLSRRMSKPLMSVAPSPAPAAAAEVTIPTLRRPISHIAEEDGRRSSLAYMSRDSIISTVSSRRSAVLPAPLFIVPKDEVDEGDEYAIFSPRIAQERHIRASTLGAPFNPPIVSSPALPQVFVLPPSPRLDETPAFINPCPPVRSSSHRAKHDLQHSPTASVSSSASTPPLSPANSSGSMTEEDDEAIEEAVLAPVAVDRSASASIYRSSALDLLGASATSPILDSDDEDEEEGEQYASDDERRYEDANETVVPVAVAVTEGLGLSTTDGAEEKATEPVFEDESPAVVAAKEQATVSASTSASSRFSMDSNGSDDVESAVVQLCERVEVVGFAM